MGRTLKRVPMDFNYPIRTVWKGYINPYYIKCEKCDGRGTTNSSYFLDRWIGVLLLATEESRYTNEDIKKFKDNGRIYPHPYLQNDPLWVRGPNDLGDQLVEITSKLADGKDFRYGISAYKVQKNLLKLLGIDEDWMICKECNGEGIHPKYLERYKSWKKTDPPEGDGFQLWETTSEGSPISPVFSSFDELCEWAEDNATTFGNFKATKEEWKKMLNDDFVYHKEGNSIFL